MSDFSKEERVAFEDILEGFNDALVLSRAVSKYRIPDAQAERTSDATYSGTIWRPQPYIAQSFDGPDFTTNFQDFTQLSVPARLGYQKGVPWQMSSAELRDALQEGRLGDAAKQKLASDVNVALMTVAANQGSIVVKRTAAAAGFADVAECDAAFNEVGVQMFDRYLALSTRDYNAMAANLAGKETHQGDVQKAYQRSYIGRLAGFETYKLDYANRLAAGTASSITVNGANQYHTPSATQGTPTTSERLNQDNRTMTLAISATGTLAAGDCFTIADVYSVHHITKASTGQLKTFRVITGGGTGDITISPPIISNGGSTDAEAQYQNVDSTPADGAAITLLNTVAANVNCFWQKDALEILPGRYAVPSDAGMSVLRGTTDQGMELVMSKQASVDTLQVKYRLDCMFGVVCKQPEMAGIMLFSQT